MNNPPAFPRPLSVDDVDPDITYPAHVGMTLRDYFAAKAMQGLLASGNLPKTMPDADLAECAYALADAMMKAREA
jgi:hypothetical protein